MRRKGVFGSILLVLFLGGCAGEPASSSALQAETPPVQAPVSSDHDHDHSAIDVVARIGPDDVAFGAESGSIIVLDVRSVSQYAAGHIRGSLHIPYGELDGRLGELPADRMIVTYCT